jgi:MFS family permease
MLGLFMVMPVLAVAAADLVDFSPLMLGLVIGGYGLTQALLQIPMGILSDKFGRKPIILVGLSVFAIGSIVAALADSMLMLLVGRILQGMGAIAGAVMALAADSSRPEQRTKVMAIIGISIGMSFYIAILLGPVIANGWGLAGVFWVTSIMAIVAILLILFVVPVPNDKPPSDEIIPQAAELKRLFFHPQLFKLNLSVAFLHLLITVLFINIPQLFVVYGFTLGSHWTLYAPVFGVSVISLVVLMRIGQGINNARMLQWAIGLLLIACLGLGFFVTYLWSALIFITLFFAGFNYLEARFPALVSSIAPAGTRGSAMGIYASFQFFGAFLGGLISGILTSWFSLPLVYAGLIVLCMFWIGLFIRFDGQSKLKRVTLNLNSSSQSADYLHDVLHNLNGVVDVKPVVEKRVVYLKVEQHFDEQAANALLEQR